MLSILFRTILGFGLTIIILFFTGMFFSYFWESGLDLSNPSSTRDWIKVCARSRSDVYCKAALRVIRDVKGPIVFLHPNTGDVQIANEIKKWDNKTSKASELEDLARANIFLGSRLRTGIMKTVDGQEREINCSAPDARVCTIDYLKGGIRNNPRKDEDGAVYSVLGSNSSFNFLLPTRHRM